MKYRVQDHSKQADSEILEALKADEWQYSRFDLTEKAVMYFLYVEKGLSNVEIFDYLSERVDGRFTKQDVTMSLRWWGLIPTHGKPLQARCSDIGEVFSFGGELHDL